MQGGIAQTIGLVLSVNAKLRGLMPATWPDASIYRFCNSVKFVGRTRRGFFPWNKTSEIFDPNTWLDTLPSSTTGAHICVFRRNDPNISERQSVVFAGGGPIFVAQMAGTVAEAWWGEWLVTNESAEDRRIWSVAYQNVASSLPNDPMEMCPPNEIRGELEKALIDAIDFSATRKMGFEQQLKNALATLAAQEPLAGYYHADIVPVGLLNLEFLQIFGCCANSWVFGGMGSWNDVCFEHDDQVLYEEISERLFTTIVRGLVIATNSSRC